MKFYRFWTRHRSQPAGCDFAVTELGFSNESPEDALQVARERAVRTAQRLAGSMSRSAEPGYYPDRPIREEIIDSFRDGDQQVAVITRNGYGSLVLNASDVLFADVDLPPTRASLWGRLLGKKPVDPAADLVANIEQQCAADPHLGMRLYRTCQGFRCLVTSRRYQPQGPEANALLVALHSDPRYIQLCRHQECFRARLSPKPWRMGLGQPPHPFPYSSPAQQQAHQQWLTQYDQAAHGFATCELVGSYGNPQIDDSIRSIVELHDHYVLHDQKPLA